MTTEKLEVKAYEARHHPVITEYARRMHLVEIIARRITGNMDVNAGVVVLAMVHDALSGRTPLFRLAHSFKTLDRAVLLGENIDCRKLSGHIAGEPPTAGSLLPGG